MYAIYFTMIARLSKRGQGRIKKFDINNRCDNAFSIFLVPSAQTAVLFLTIVKSLSAGLIGNHALDLYHPLRHLEVLTIDPRTLRPNYCLISMYHSPW
jgi:hypothetical protein